MMDVRRKNLRIFFALLLILGSAFASSCTRSANGESQVKLLFPSSENLKNGFSSSSTVEMPAHVAVNISGKEFPTIFWSWDSHGSSDIVAPPGVSITVPQGTARLIQVLYVTADSDHNLYFYYSDVTQDLTSAAVPVAITVSAITSSSTQGKLVGRYLNSTGSGPTGVLNTYFTPAAGRPPMIVDQNEIFGGWFSAFLLPSINFTYKTDDGTILFADYKADPSFATSQAAAFVSVPASYRIYSGSSNPQNYNSASYILAGFFGPGSSAKKICFNANSASAIPHLFSDLAGTTQTYWNGSEAGSCSTSQACLVAGGTNLATNCSTIDNLNTMKFDDTLLASSDQIMLFRGPFQIINSGSGNTQQLTGNLSGSNLTLGWQYMPGATSGLDGVEAFYKWETQFNSSGKPPYQINNGYDCERLVSNYGFISGAQVPAPQVTTTVNVGNVGNPVAGQNLVAILCPYSRAKNPMYFRTAMQWYNNSFATSSNQLVLVDASSGPNNTSSVGACKHYLLQLQTPFGTTFVTPNALPVTLSANSAGGNLIGSGFSLASNCSSPNPYLSINLAAGSTTADVYFTASANDYYGLNAQAPGFMSMTLDFGAVQATAINIAVKSNGSMASGQCYPVEVLIQNSTFHPATTAESFQMSLGGGLTGSFYTDQYCASVALPAASAIVMPTASHAMTLYFRPSVTTLTPSGSLSLTSVTPPLTIFSQAVSADTATQLSGVGTLAYNISSGMGSATYDPGQCVPLYISAINSVGAPISPVSDQSVQVTTLTGGQIYTDTCGGTPLGATSYLIRSGMPTQPLFFMPSAVSASVKITDSIGRFSNTLALSVRLPTNFKWVGSIPNMSSGMCYPAAIQALTNMGQPYQYMNAQSYAFTGAEQFFTDSTCLTSTPNINFTAGLSSPSSLYMKFINTGPPSLSLTLGPSYSVNFAGLSLYQTFLMPIGPFAGCSMTSGGSLTFMVQANSSMVPAAYVPSLNFTALTLSGGTFTPKFCVSTGTPYGSCVGAGALSLAAGQNMSSGTPLNIKTSGQLADTFSVLPGGLPTGLQIGATPVNCN